MVSVRFLDCLFGFVEGDIKIGNSFLSAPSEKSFQRRIRIQAFQNSVFAAMCNRVGQEDAMLFSGESLVIGPDGELLALAGSGEELLLCEIDPERAAARRAEKVYTGLRRRELYE